MKCLIRHGGLGLLLLLCALPAARGQIAPLRISQILVTNIGPPAAGDQLVRANIHFHPGDLYIPAGVDKDVRNLYATGLFADIRVSSNNPSAGIIDLTYVLQGKPRLTDIRFEGNTKYTIGQLKKKVTSKVGQPLDDLKLFNDGQAIATMYEKSGYYHTIVNPRVTDQDEHAGTAAVVFDIQETNKIRVVAVEFVGARAFPQSKLAKVIKTRKHGMFSWLTRSGVFKEDQFYDEDLPALRSYYQTNGYIDFEITATNIIHLNPNDIKIQFVVDEGNQYRVGTITFKGNQLFTTEQLIAGLKTQHGLTRSKAKIGAHGLQDDVGMVFKPQIVEPDGPDIKAIIDFYDSRGYLDVGLRDGGLRIRRIPNTETGTVDIEYDLEEGRQSTVEKIEIIGNVKTKDKVIRRELTIAPGDVFDMVKVRLSKQRLEGLDYFEKVEARPESDPTLENQKNLVIGVDEKSTGQFKVGAGFSTVQSISGFVEVTQNNFDLFNPPYFTGGGQKFLIHAELGTLLQDYRVSFVEPWFLDRHLTLGVDFYYTLSDFDSLDGLYDDSRAGIRLSLSRALFGRDNFIGTISYNLEDVDILHVSTNAPDAIIQDAGSVLVSRFGAGLAYDTRSGVDLPNKGQRTSLTSTLTVGDRRYVNTEFLSAWYFKGFGAGDVLEVIGKVGVVKSLESADVPFYDRLYLGGLTDLRGYDYRGVGPRAVTQDGLGYEPIGGDTRWSGSVEYSFPIVDPVRFALFYDIGNVSARPFSNAGFDVNGRSFAPHLPPPVTVPTGSPLAGNTGGYSDNYGFGIHINIPHLGPLRLDYGIPIHHDVFSGSGGKFQFGVGFNKPL